MRTLRRAACISIAAACMGFSGQNWAACLDSGVQVQILGSGGPGPSAGRASSGYVVWIDGVGRIMVDAGSGTKDQFHAAGASLEDIELLALSHFHPDHSAELPAILWPAGSQARLSGPTGDGSFPSVSEFLERLFGQNGAFPVFADRVQFDVFTVDTAGRDVVEVWNADDILVRAIGVPHANVPTIGYRVDVGDASIAFSSDQNGSDPSFIEFIQDVDVLVIHMTVGENASGFGAQLHAKPSVWGQLATQGEVGRIVVSHISAPSPQVLQARLDVLRDNYSGPVTVGEDLLCVAVN
jgi:ribonuclease BN (tRNA processing enzyme)